MSAEAPTVSKIGQRIASGIGRVITDEGEVVLPPPSDGSAKPVEVRKASLTMGERFEHLAVKQAGSPEDQSRLKKDDGGSGGAPAAQPHAAGAPPAQPDKKAPESIEQHRSEVPPVSRSPGVVVVDVEIPKELDELLDDSDRDEFQVIAHAEKSKLAGCDGLTKKFESFAKARKAFIDENPGVSQEEIDQWNAENAPDFPRGMRRKAEMSYITAKAKAEARKELQEDLKPLEEQKRKAEVKPVIDGALDIVEAGLDQSVFSKEAIAAIRSNKASDDDLAPIIHAAFKAAQSWMDIGLGVSEFDPKNPMHTWLLQFVDAETKLFASKASDELKKRDGKEFMPYVEFYTKAEKDKTVSDKFWTWNDDDVVKRISAAATQQAKGEIDRAKRLAARGSTTPARPAQPAASAASTALGGTRPSPGATGAAAAGAATPMPRIMGGLGVKTA